MEARSLGNYQLLQALNQTTEYITWLAEQKSVSRKVILHELIDPEQRDDFMANGRLQATVDDARISSIYEAATTPESCFIVSEYLPDPSLAQHLAAGHVITPASMANILRSLADVMIYFRSKGITTKPLQTSHIHVSENGVVRIQNIARSGLADADAETNDIIALGHALPPLVKHNAPATGRILTVLSWMRGENVEHPLSWEQIQDYCRQIEAQLAEAAAKVHADALNAHNKKSEKRKRSLTILASTIGLLLILLAALMVTQFSGKNNASVKNADSPPPLIHISSGSYATPDKTELDLSEFKIELQPVSIGDYEKFLAALAEEPDMATQYDSGDQPSEKSDHTPEYWGKMLTVAREGGLWNDISINLETPVVNIDWWDAYAYCKWKGGQLPTQEQWYASLMNTTAESNGEEAADAGENKQNALPDSFPAKLANPYFEWSKEPATNPANPIGMKNYPLLNYSDSTEGTRSFSRQWASSREMRRPDLGFRVLYTQP